MDDREDDRHLHEAFVAPFYLSLLNSGFVFMDRNQSKAFRQQLLAVARSITDEQIRSLLEIRDWRDRLAAGWFAGISRRVQLVDDIGNYLTAINEEYCRPGNEIDETYGHQGLCVALGVIGGRGSRNYLYKYLEMYIDRHGTLTEQNWALGALVRLEGIVPQEFSDPRLWPGSPSAINSVVRFANLVSYLYQYAMIMPDA
jgi:hypothetical protein